MKHGVTISEFKNLKTTIRIGRIDSSSFTEFRLYRNSLCVHHSRFLETLVVPYRNLILEELDKLSKKKKKYYF